MERDLCNYEKDSSNDKGINMNVYDFDGTILRGDTEDYFREYANKNFKIKFRHKVQLKFFDFLFNIKIIDEPHYRVHTYPYFPYIPNLEENLKKFWDIHEKDIFDYYLKNHRDDDVVVSATPRPLLEEIIKRLKIKTLIATEMDIKTGKVYKKCRGKSKVTRYNEVFNETPIDNYYFDKDHDMYLMKYAKNGFRVIDGILKREK